MYVIWRDKHYGFAKTSTEILDIDKILIRQINLTKFN